MDFIEWFRVILQYAAFFNSEKNEEHIKVGPAYNE